MKNLDLETTRSVYIPKNATRVAAKGCAAVFYTFAGTQGRPTAIAFLGAARKPSWRFWFRSEADRAKRIAAAIEAQTALEATKADRKAALKAEMANPVALVVGDILSCSWGYDQTNVDFYQVTALIGTSMVEVREIAGDETGNGLAMQGTVVAVRDRFIGEPQKFKVVGSGRDAIKPASYSWAAKWDGRPLHVSSYA